jgi:hypothetical protein
VLEWLANTALARMVQESMWGYPIILSAHAVGMAIFGGIVLVINLRVLGLAPGMSFSGLRTIYRICWAGLLLNAVSGALLFSADGERFISSTPFLIKLMLLTTTIVLFAIMARQIFSSPQSIGNLPSSTRVMAAISTLSLLGIIVAGRLIAYVGGT